MRTSSERNPGGIPPDTPPTDTEGVRPDTGYGYGYGKEGRTSSKKVSSYKRNKQYREYKEWKPDQDGMPPWSERRRELFDWADRNLPDQHPGLVVVAILAIRLGGVKPTKELVLERLRATGREASQIGYGPGGYAA